MSIWASVSIVNFPRFASNPLMSAVTNDGANGLDGHDGHNGGDVPNAGGIQVNRSTFFVASLLILSVFLYTSIM